MQSIHIYGSRKNKLEVNDNIFNLKYHSIFNEQNKFNVISRTDPANEMNKRSIDLNGHPCDSGDLIKINNGRRIVHFYPLIQSK